MRAGTTSVRAGGGPGGGGGRSGCCRRSHPRRLGATAPGCSWRVDSEPFVTAADGQAKSGSLDSFLLSLPSWALPSLPSCLSLLSLPPAPFPLCSTLPSLSLNSQPPPPPFLIPFPRPFFSPRKQRAWLSANPLPISLWLPALLQYEAARVARAANLQDREADAGVRCSAAAVYACRATVAGGRSSSRPPASALKQGSLVTPRLERSCARL
jgi:hypothetical protein